MTARLRRHGDDAGLTLVELLVAMVVAMVLAAVSMTAVNMSGSAVKTAAASQDLNEEARQAINRMARDLRQANAVVAVVNPDGPSFSPSGIVAIRAQADFDGDGCIGGTGGGCPPDNPSNPEDVAYCFDPVSRQLYVIDDLATGVTPISATSNACTGGLPLLAGNVSSFSIEYRSNEYRYDLDPSDGVTTWRELDEAPPPVGNANGALDVELPRIDSVVLNMTMSVNGRTQTYRTQVDLRNKS
jgi:type II secretory pathway pseudopilin PulG